MALLYLMAWAGLLRPPLFPDGIQVEILHLLSRPGSSAQEFQTGSDTGVIGKAFDADAVPQILPAEMLHKLVEDHFECNAVQRVVRSFIRHGCY